MLVYFISGAEIFVIFLIVLLLFGADKIPDIAKGLGKGIRQVKDATQEIKTEIQEVSGVAFLAKSVDLDAQSMKDISFELGKTYENLFMLLGSSQGGKAILSCYISKSLVSEKSLDAGKVVRELGKFIQGGGGGQPFFATAGGKNPEGIPQALSASKELI